MRTRLVTVEIVSDDLRTSSRLGKASCTRRIDIDDPHEVQALFHDVKITLEGYQKPGDENKP